MDINQTNLDALEKGYRVIFMAALQAAKPKWMSLAMRAASTGAEEFYQWLGAVPGMRKLLGEIVIRNLSNHKFSIPNDEFESTVAVPQASVERDTYGIYNPLMEAMGLAAAMHPDELVAALLINGFAQKCYTGKNFFDNDHEPVKGKAKFSNKGTKKLSATNYELARANIKSRLNTEGRSMNLGIDLVLVVSPTYEATARKIVIADKDPSGADNVNKGTARLEVWPQLATSEHAWFLLEAGNPIKALIFQEEKKTSFASLTSQTSDHVFKKKEFLYQGYGRYNAGYGLPELAFGSTGADPA